MRYAILLTLLCGMAAWGQTAKPNAATGTIDCNVHAKEPFCQALTSSTVFIAPAPVDHGTFRVEAVCVAIYADGFQDYEPCSKFPPMQNADSIGGEHLPAPAAQPAQRPAKQRVICPGGAPPDPKNCVQVDNFTYSQEDFDKLTHPPAAQTEPQSKPEPTCGLMRDMQIGPAHAQNNYVPCPDPPAPSLSCAPECRFEIKTKVESANFLANGKWPYTPMCPAGYRMAAPVENGACVRTAHSLYLNGKLLGTLSEK